MGQTYQPPAVDGLVLDFFNLVGSLIPFDTIYIHFIPFDSVHYKIHKIHHILLKFPNILYIIGYIRYIIIYHNCLFLCSFLLVLDVLDSTCTEPVRPLGPCSVRDASDLSDLSNSEPIGLVELRGTSSGREASSGVVTTCKHWGRKNCRQC